MNFGEFKKGKAQQELPPLLIAKESQIADFEKSCHELCIRLLRLFALGLRVRRPERSGDMHQNITIAHRSILRKAA